MVLGNHGIPNTAFGFAAGFVGEEIVRRIEEMGVKAEFIWIGDGVSRINLKLKSIDGTEINGCGPVIHEGDVQKLIAKLELLQAGDVLVLAGSIPGSVPDDIYRRIMSEMSGRGIEVVVDATKELLVNVLEYHPFLIKPNHHELGGIFGVELKTREDVIPYARRMQQMGGKECPCLHGGSRCGSGGGGQIGVRDRRAKGDPGKWRRSRRFDGCGISCRMDGEKRISSCVCHGRLGRKRQCVFGTTCREKRDHGFVSERIYPIMNVFFGEKICRPCTKEHKYPCTWPAGLFFV